jgi:lipoprotein NlpD
MSARGILGRMESMSRIASVLLLALLLGACGHSRVVQREPGARTAGAPASTPAPPRGGAGTYTVRGGDTLYGIAFRHGVDYRDVAAWNRIPAPYTIYPGQSLRLRAPGGRAPVAATPPPHAPPPRPGNGSVTGMPAPRTTPTSTPTSGFVTVPPATAGTATVPPPGPTAAPTPTPVPVPISTAPPAVPVAAAPPMAVVPGAVSATGWRWPTQGQLIGRFAVGDPKRQGLDIAGTAGQAVVAAADGVVVYSGAGLVGYGELIIVKHSDEWLSAYAHNRRRLVAEGTAVKGGQPIAELGRSGTSRDMLHFEVRRNGKPVDPLTVLPPP